MLIVFAIIVSACGGNSEPAPANGQQNAAGTNASGSDSASAGGEKEEEAQGGSDTRIVKTVKGDIEIPANPQRIVAGYYHGTLLSLGIHPIGGSKEWWMGSPFLTSEEQTIEDIGSPASLEKVLALEPDLIVINDTLIDSYDALSKIAPTLLIPYDSIKNIRQEITIFGDLLNKQEEASKWHADYEDKAKQAKEKLKGIVKPGMTASLLETDGKTIAMLGDNYGRGGEVIYHVFGFKAPPLVQKDVIDSGEQYKTVSLEVLPEYLNADYIFLSSYPDGTDEALNTLMESSVWKSLKAVKEGHVISLDYKTYFYFDPVSTFGQIDTLTDLLLRNQAQ
ncbi:iron-hydroxamate ABC transporter substrate-binding protein [Paenibacillus sepulcri]|uniref:Iron-hydroxamate ABC transporter substrate-binding protein n=1 Tax=Paenibacillus sepulcri TaxID=359917 RepID=A0ABS7CAH8_9BACL|nr:iron-hydroxamate ABC transporter substrate-binding protein [Paenibacillus sepulcri]